MKLILLKLEFILFSELDLLVNDNEGDNWNWNLCYYFSKMWMTIILIII